MKCSRQVRAFHCTSSRVLLSWTQVIMAAFTKSVHKTGLDRTGHYLRTDPSQNSSSHYCVVEAGFSSVVSFANAHCLDNKGHIRW